MSSLLKTIADVLNYKILSCAESTILTQKDNEMFVFYFLGGNFHIVKWNVYIDNAIADTVPAFKISDITTEIENINVNDIKDITIDSFDFLDID